MPMSIGTDSSPDALIQLAKDIRTNIENIESLNTKLSEQLQRLGASFLDDDFSIIQDFVKRTQNICENIFPDGRRTAAGLEQYAQILIDAAAATKGK
jgi:hypothetical protein